MTTQVSYSESSDPHRTSPQAVRIFVNPAGQRDNLGDSVLRRPYLNALRSRGVLHIYTGAQTDYVSGLGVQPADVAYESKLKWFGSFFVSALREPVYFAVNAGEVVGGVRQWVRSAWQVPVAVAARCSRGRVVLAGVSLRVGAHASVTHLKFLARAARLVTWRDQHARASIGRGEVQPDWAFAIKGEGLEATERDKVAVTVRGDRPAPSEQFLQSLLEFSTAEGAELWVVVQVRRDTEAAKALALRLGANLLEWPETASHWEHERDVRKLYATCLAIISDRIHALIIGATEGAIPIGVTTAGSAKLERTVASEVPLTVMDGRYMQPLEKWRHALQRGRVELAPALANSRSRIAAVTNWIQELR